MRMGIPIHGGKLQGFTPYLGLLTLLLTLTQGYPRSPSWLFDNFALAATTYQSHVDNLVGRIRKLTETNNIMEDQLNQLAESNVILERQGK